MERRFYRSSFTFRDEDENSRRLDIDRVFNIRNHRSARSLRRHRFGRNDRSCCVFYLERIEEDRGLHRRSYTVVTNFVFKLKD